MGRSGMACGRGLYPPGVFTGLVQAVGVVAGAEPRGMGLRLRVDPRGWSHRPTPGDSISVSGVCLTVAEGPSRDAGVIEFDAVAETLGLPRFIGKPFDVAKLLSLLRSNDAPPCDNEL